MIYITSVVWGEILFSSFSLVFSSSSDIAWKQLKQLDKSCCPDGWIRHLCLVCMDKRGMPKDYQRVKVRETVMYVKQHQKRKTWHDAVRVYESEGASVATIGTREMVHLAESLFMTPVQLWLGLRDVFQNGSYYWTNGSTLASSPGTRDNEKTRWDQDCVAILIFPSLHCEWLDLNCRCRRRYLCEVTPTKCHSNSVHSM